MKSFARGSPVQDPKAGGHAATDPFEIVRNFANLIAQKNQPTTAPPYSIRLPKVGTLDQYFGLTRSHWNGLILGGSPAVHSFVDRKPGKQRGVRLILFSSALAYFQCLATQQTAQKGEL